MLKILEEDIKNGHPNKSMECPVALALKRDLKDYPITGVYVFPYATLIKFGPKTAEILNTEEIVIWVERFDNRKFAIPTNFNWPALELFKKKFNSIRRLQSSFGD